jgi:hypothetical protein
MAAHPVFLHFLQALLSDSEAPAPEHAAGIGAFSIEEHGALSQVQAVLGGDGTSHRVLKWELSYGCLLLVACPRADEHQRHLYVLGLDGWQHNVMGKTPTAVPAQAGVTLAIGNIPVASLVTFQKAYAKVMKPVKSRKGPQRSAANSHGGHQFTPAFVLALAQAALAEAVAPACYNDDSLAERVLDRLAANPSRGGFTDVGRHTGGEPRDTQLALTMALAFHVLCHCNGNDCRPLLEPAVVFEHLAAEFYLWQAEQSLVETDTGWTPQAIDAVMSALKLGAASGAALADSGLRDMHPFVLRCEAARAALAAAVTAQAQAMADNFVLRLSMPTSAELSAMPSPTMQLSAPSREALGPDIEAARARAFGNIVWVP